MLTLRFAYFAIDEEPIFIFFKSESVIRFSVFLRGWLAWGVRALDRIKITNPHDGRFVISSAEYQYYIGEQLK